MPNTLGSRRSTDPSNPGFKILDVESWIDEGGNQSIGVQLINLLEAQFQMADGVSTLR